MRPLQLASKIFLDSGDPGETRKVLDLLGFLDGQTTNPTLLSKNPTIIQKKSEGAISKEDIFPLYRDVVSEISSLIPQGSVSIEIFADMETSADDMLRQARDMYQWIPNAHIKFPTITEGLKAAESFTNEGNRVNMTLCFSEEQAAAVYAATRNAKKGDVYISPFIGRLDDIGINGLGLVQNIEKLYTNSDHHVEVLAASIRTVDQLMAAFFAHADIVTVPFKVLEEWAKKGMPLPGEQFTYDTSHLQTLEYQDLDLSQQYTSFNISHSLTTKGIEKFTEDINTLLA